jgi:hypothetical protein
MAGTAVANRVATGPATPRNQYPSHGIPFPQSATAAIQITGDRLERESSGGSAGDRRAVAARRTSSGDAWRDDADVESVSTAVDAYEQGAIRSLGFIAKWIICY